MLRAEIEQLRANGHDWNDVAELLKDDGQGGGITIKGSTLKSFLAAPKTSSTRRNRKEKGQPSKGDNMHNMPEL
jgi:hypothetical protein